MLKDLPIPKGYKEKEDLWVKIYGTHEKRKKKVVMRCFVPTLEGWKDAGCNIDTGMSASIIAQMIKGGFILDKGSFAPEIVVPPKMFFSELRKREMIIYKNGKKIN